MSKTLLDYLDEILLPSSLMIVSKFVGVFVAILIFGVDWTLKEYSSELFAFGETTTLSDAMTITTYSDLFMFIVMALFFSFSVVRAVFFHTTHISQELLYKLTVNNLNGLVRSSFVIYKSASIWLTFTLISNLIILYNVAQGKSYTWILPITLFFSFSLVIILLTDVAREVKAQRKSQN